MKERRDHLKFLSNSKLKTSAAKHGGSAALFGGQNSKLSFRGSILIASLWAVSILSVFMASLVLNSRQEMILLKRELSSVESKLDFNSGLSLFSQKLLEDPKPHEDSSSDPWYGALLLPEPWEKRLSVEVQDEEAKINIQFASDRLLDEFLKVFAEEINPLKTGRKTLKKQILKSRSKGKIESYEELYLLEGIEPDDIESLRPYFTVYTEENKINPNTASNLVLKALIRSLTNDFYSGEELLRKMDEHRKRVLSGEDVPISSTNLTPDSFQKKLRLTPTLAMMTLLNRILPLFTVDSKTYSIAITSHSGSRAEGVVKESLNREGLEVLSWSERQ